MQFTKLIPTTMLALLFVAAINAHAKAPSLGICPSIEKIHQSAHLINQAGVDQKNNKRRYIAWTDKTVLQESGYHWAIFAINIVASSHDEAIANAQKLASQVSFMLDTQGSMTLCGYFTTMPTPNNNIQNTTFVIAAGSTKPLPVNANLVSSVRFS